MDHAKDPPAHNAVFFVGRQLLIEHCFDLKVSWSVI
jgi:hypothetical protein